MKPTSETIWNEFSSKLAQFIRARVADPATAEDLLQDVFLKFHARLDEFQDPAKLQGWLFLVARNAIIDYYRTRKKTTELTPSLLADSPEHDTESEELKTVFHLLINSLPEPYREAVLLSEFEGLSREQLAKQLRISLSSAKSRVQRGREQLKEMLLDYCHNEFSRTVGSQPCPKGLLPPIQETTNGRKHTPRCLRKKSRK